LLRHSLVSLLTCLPFLRLSLTSPIGIRDYGDHPMIVLILSAIILKEHAQTHGRGYYLRTNGHGISYIIR
jgi:hypothetical protein